MSNTMKKSTDISQLTKAKEFHDKFLEILGDRTNSGMDIDNHPEFNSEDVAVRVRDFYLRYGDNPHTLYNVNIEIPKRKITAIIGPSGCGKSTLLKSINRMNEEITKVDHEGEIYVGDENVYDEQIDILALRTRVGMIFQKPQPFPRSIYDNVAFGPRLHGVKNRDQLDRIIENSLRDVGLWKEVSDRLDDHAFGLSGGQQQRLCIARSIAVNPSVILADEPASALDPQSTYQIEELLLKLKEKYTVCIVTHNMQQAARISDYTFFMFLGNIVEYARTDKIFENPFYDLTERYISGRFG